MEERHELCSKLMTKGLAYFHQVPIISSAIEVLPRKSIFHGLLFMEPEMWFILWRMYPIGSDKRKEFSNKAQECIKKYGLEGTEVDCY